MRQENTIEPGERSWASRIPLGWKNLLEAGEPS
jgi:hypothetical protein